MTALRRETTPTDIRMRAEAKAGQLLTEMKAKAERHRGANPQNFRESPEVTPVTPTLADIGVIKSESSRWLGNSGTAQVGSVAWAAN